MGIEDTPIKEEVKTSEAIDAELFDLYDKTIKSGLSPITTTKASNIKEFKTKLVNDDQTLDDFVPNYIDPIEQNNLDELEATIENIDLPDFVKEIYKEKLKDARREVILQEARGKKEFTTAQYSPEKWAKLIDLDKTKENGETTLLFEQEAIEVLEQPFVENLPFKTVREFSVIMNFSAEEIKALNFSDEDLDNPSISIDSQHQKNIMEVYLKRLKISGWTIELTNVPATNVISKDKKIVVPIDGQKDILAFVIGAHEIGTHVYRSEKGALQKVSIWKYGEPDYDETEEGLATFIEYLMGEPFGHMRQKEFAARYFAIAMALKTKKDVNDKLVAKYSPREIYEKLREYGIAENAAATIIWRIFRGTSFKQEIVEIKVQAGEEEVPIQIPECFAKDYIYFAGMKKVFTWIKRTLPYLSYLQQAPGSKENLGHDLEINDYYLKLLGYAYARLTKGKNLREIMKEKEQQKDLLSYGRESLLNIYDYFCEMGKVSMETVLNPEIRNFVTSENKNGSSLSIRNLFIPS